MPRYWISAHLARSMSLKSLSAAFSRSFSPRFHADAQHRNALPHERFCRRNRSPLGDGRKKDHRVYPFRALRGIFPRGAGGIAVFV